MKHTLSIVILTFLAPVFSTSAETLMSLSECIRTAVANNIGLENYRVDEKKGENSYNQQRSLLLPSVNGTLQMSDYFKNPVNVTASALLDSDFADDPTWGKVKSMQYQETAALQVQLPLYNQTIYESIKAARLIKEIYGLSYDLAREKLTVQVASTYYLCQTSGELCRIQEENISRMEELCRIAKDMFDRGLVLETDYTRVQIRLRDITTLRDQYRTAHGQQLNILRFLMDLPAESSFDVMALEEDFTSPVLTGSSDSLPELELIRKRISLTDKQIDVVNSGYIPSVSLFAQAGYQGFQDKISHFFKDDNSAGWFGHSVAGVQVNIPIFDSNRKKTQVKEYRLDRSKLRNSLYEQQEALDRDYRNACLLLRQNEEQWDTQRLNYRQSVDVYNITALKYNEGVSSMTELLQDEMRISNAQSAGVQALGQCWQARLELLRLQGNLDILSE